MSISAISSADQQDKKFRNNMIVATGAGAVAGGSVTAMRKRYMYDGLPSDTFVKKVSNNLRKTMTPEEKKETAKIHKFLSKVADPEVDIETLKPMIKDSKELSEAIKATPDESVDDAITRVYSQPKAQIKKDLSELQNKTHSNKIASTNTALQTIWKNYDKDTKKFVKNENTSDKVFKMIKNTARKVQVKTVATVAAMTGVVAGALCLVASDIPGTNNK